jgi:hypothetical protein
METLITIAVLLLLSAASNWLQKRSQAKPNDSASDPDEETAPPRPLERDFPGPAKIPQTPKGAPMPVPPKAPAWDWAGELRRILEEDTPRPPQPQVPRPTVPPAVPSSLPPRLAVPTVKMPGPVSSSRPPVSTPVLPPPPVVLRPPVEPDILTVSKKAYETASRLSTNMTGRMHKIAELPATAPAPGIDRRVNVEIIEALQLVRQPTSARQAIIVSTILGAPRALEPF